MKNYKKKFDGINWENLKHENYNKIIYFSPLSFHQTKDLRFSFLIIFLPFSGSNFFLKMKHIISLQIIGGSQFSNYVKLNTHPKKKKECEIKWAPLPIFNDTLIRPFQLRTVELKVVVTGQRSDSMCDFWGAFFCGLINKASHVPRHYFNGPLHYL